jgi:hypothetical protein
MFWWKDYFDKLKIGFKVIEDYTELSPELVEKILFSTRRNYQYATNVLLAGVDNNI